MPRPNEAGRYGEQDASKNVRINWVEIEETCADYGPQGSPESLRRADASRYGTLLVDRRTATRLTRPGRTNTRCDATEVTLDEKSGRDLNG